MKRLAPIGTAGAAGAIGAASAAAGLEALERFIDRLRELPHVYATMTMLSLSTTP